MSVGLRQSAFRGQFSQQGGCSVPQTSQKIVVDHSGSQHHDYMLPGLLISWWWPETCVWKALNLQIPACSKLNISIRTKQWCMGGGGRDTPGGGRCPTEDNSWGAAAYFCSPSEGGVGNLWHVKIWDPTEYFYLPKSAPPPPHSPLPPLPPTPPPSPSSSFFFLFS